MNRNLITLALVLSLSACSSDDSSSSGVDVNTPAVITGEITGSVDETADSISGVLTVTDVDQGESSFNAQNNVTTTYGTFTLTPDAANGNWTYELDTTNADIIALNGGETLTDIIIVKSIDGTQSTINITITGYDTFILIPDTGNDGTQSTIVGDLTANINNDQSSAQTGILTVIDLEGDSIVQQSGINGLYGVFDISAEGTWTYSLDVNTVANLSAGEEVTDSFTVETTDGVSSTVVITISGKSRPIIVVDTNNLGIQIVDTVPGATVGGSYTGQGTTGQFIKEIDEIDSGTFSATVQIQKNPDTTVPDNASQLNNVGYMTLEHSSSTAPVAEVAFRNGSVSYRSGSNGLTSTGLTYNEGDVMAVQIDWDESNYYISIDGGKTRVGPYVGPTVFSSNYGQTESKVNRLSFQLSNDSSHSQYEFNVDQIRLDEADVDLSFEVDKYAIGSKLLGDNVEVTIQKMDFFEIKATDDFESYIDGVQIDGANSVYKTTADNTDGFANISATKASSGNNSLYIENSSFYDDFVVSRAFTGGAADSGSVSLSIYVPAISNKATYIHLGTSEEGDEAARFSGFTLQGGYIKFTRENGFGVSMAPYTTDTWVDITISWVGQAITLNIDGTEYTEYNLNGVIYPMVAATDVNEQPTLVVFKVDQKNDVNPSVYIDDLDSALFDE